MKVSRTNSRKFMPAEAQNNILADGYEHYLNAMGAIHSNTFAI